MAIDPQAPVDLSTDTTQAPAQVPGAPVEIAPQEAPATEEEVQVAMAGPVKSIFRAAADKAEELKAQKAEAPPPAPSGRAPLEIIDDPLEGPTIVIRPVEEATAQRIRDLTNVPDDIEIRAPLPNLNTMNLTEAQQNLVRSLNQVFEEDILTHRRSQQSIADIMEKAQQVGMDDAIIELLSRKPGTAANDVQIARYIWVRMVSASHLETLMNDIRSGGENASNAKKAELLRYLPIAANIEASTRGAIAEAGRSLAVVAYAGKSDMMDVGAVRELPALMQRYQITEENLDDFVAGYFALPIEKGTRQRYLRNIWNGGMDMFAEAFLNSLLSSPVTDAVNVLSNTLFQGMQIPERALGAVIGKVRVQFTGSTDRVRFGESYRMLMSLPRGLKLGMKAGWKAIRHEEGTFGDPALSKIDARADKAISGAYWGINSDSSKFGQMVGRFLDVYGVATRAFGSRMLLMEDEFAKGVSYQMELEALAQRHMDSILENGGSTDEAITAGARILAGMDARTIKMAEDFAITTTFQEGLQLSAPIGKVFAHPLSKIFVPFYKTPMNIFDEGPMKRTLLGLFPGSGFWTEISAGGARADMAMSKMALGTGIFATVAYMASGVEMPGFAITGAGPTDPKARRAWRDLGFMPYAIAHETEPGKWESWQYGRFAPIAGIFGMGADYAYYSQYEDDTNILEGIFTHGAFSVMEQMSQYPMMQGVMQLGELFGDEYETPKARFDRLVELLGKQVTSAVISAGPPIPGTVLGTGSLMGTIERSLDPTASNVMPTDEQYGGRLELGALYSGYLEAINRAKSRNPFFSDEVPVKLNLWAETMQQCTGGLWCFISPIRVMDSKWNRVDAEMVRLMGGVQMPRKKQKGIDLTAEEYNTMIILMNTLPMGGETMLQRMENTINEEWYQNKNVEDQLAELNSIVTDYRNQALNQHVFNSTDASLRKELREKLLEDEKNKPRQSIPPMTDPTTGLRM